MHGCASFFGYNEIRSMSGLERILLECILVCSACKKIEILKTALETHIVIPMKCHFFLRSITGFIAVNSNTALAQIIYLSEIFIFE